MGQFSVYCDPEGLEELVDKTPFNLKKDLKGMEEDEINTIAEALANELYSGMNRPPTSVVPYWGKGRKAAWVKIRVVDLKRDSGKSNGYRCILLVDTIHNSAFLLHIYRHAHGEDENISSKEKNQLKSLVNEYIDSLDAINKKQMNK